MKPFVEELDLTSDELLSALLALPASQHVCILDSCGTNPPDGRLLIAGFDPKEIIELRGNTMTIRDRDGSCEEISSEHFLDEWLERFSQDSSIGPSACIGAFAYEFGGILEQFRNRVFSIPENLPLATLYFFDSLIIHDYETGITRIIGNQSTDPVSSLKRALLEAMPYDPLDTHDGTPIRDSSHLKSNFTFPEYIQAVGRIKAHIAAGDIYQANLTQRFTAEMQSDVTAEDVFRRLRRDNPASFTAFIRNRDGATVSSSPERFFKVENTNAGRQIEASPIKGTCPRGRTIEEDEKLRLDLATSEKDRAENVMIVDLVRNDLGRVCEYGSIEVCELFGIQANPTLYHLVSKVRGKLRNDASIIDIFRAAFPCGSITGAPKIRAMEIINQIEQTPRGMSMGAIGYTGFDGRMDFSVAIRTITFRGNTATFNVGGGVVADSDPEGEFKESMLKAKALLGALGF